MTGPGRLLFLAAGTFALGLMCAAQNSGDAMKRGEEVFAKSCSTGYCHGVNGGPGGAPRLAGRGFDQNYISGVVGRGIPDTAMMSFAGRLPRQDLAAVVAYVAGLNGVVSPGAADSGANAAALTGDAARGAQLFRDAVRGFGRCATCHEVGGFGIPVAGAMARVPSTTAEMRSLATPNVKTAVMDGESMPVLVLSNGRQSAVFYDLTSPPPVQRSAGPGAVKIADGSAWRHSSVIGAYNDSELGSVLSYLRAAVRDAR